MTNITMTVKTATTALNEPPPSPFERLPLALGLLLPLFGTQAVRGGCGRFPRPWEWRCLQCSAWPQLRA